jgi:ABC-2 type transport system ATP-binding protein
VVIINKGRVVAIDSPENLTHQLKGAAVLYVQVGGAADASGVLSQVPGVRHVRLADQHNDFAGYEIEAEPHRDVRRDVASAIVTGGLGLLELRPMRMSLEEIFLQLTTEDRDSGTTGSSGSSGEEVQHG